MTQSKAGRRIDVWVIEDNDELRSTLVEVIGRDKELLCSHDYANCEDALTQLKNESPPNVILMDIALPGMSGIEGVRRIKAMSPAT